MHVTQRGASVAVLLGMMVAGCATAEAQIASSGMALVAPRPVEVQAVSLLGDSLRRFPLSDATRQRYASQLAEARRAYEHAPTNLDSIIWYGRRLAYLGALREAIEVFSHGLTLYPDNAWLLRHRGHRYISVREFDRAIADLERAVVVTRGRPDEVEPDGQPNARGIPIGTLQSNIGYHLALAYYLKGNWARAAEVARREVAAATNDDRRVSMVHWLYMALRRSGREADAAREIEAFRRPLQVVENQAYERLIALYLGDSAVAATMGAVGGPQSSSDASLAYGVANWHFYNGRRDEALRQLEKILAGGQWGAFGAIAAEADLARLRVK